MRCYWEDVVEQLQVDELIFEQRFFSFEGYWSRANEYDNIV